MKRTIAVMISSLLGACLSTGVSALYVFHVLFNDPNISSDTCAGPILGGLIIWSGVFGFFAGGIAAGVPGIGWLGLLGMDGGVLLIFCFLCLTGSYSISESLEFGLLVAGPQIPTLLAGWAVNRLVGAGGTNTTRHDTEAAADSAEGKPRESQET
jgi:hypothetical protein